MKVYKTTKGILIHYQDAFYLLEGIDWDSFINDDNLYDKVAKLASSNAPIANGPDLLANELEAPIESQEIWASGVTYYNSKLGREEESKEAGGADFYGRVYDAKRPELFFKATKSRTVGPGGKVRIRKDSSWDVPEPELTLVITSSGTIVGYTIGNDMSSRSIEGENPLYLPQAKCYDGSAAIGPCIYVTNEPLPPDTQVELEIKRNGSVVFEEKIEISQIKRNLTDLVSYLYRECSFPDGSLLMTGTGIVPSNEFTLQHDDEISITIDPIGTLINKVR
ncbi:fumarylacetoacetate hydrolase family protein [Fodinibius salsisoli]|uniref:Fumarylacetoacetate hydrolase family protein n=1 Tax=Fodinibius salsisoli TaxID=2820877 RepID=A0ABT3PJF8_9BACT|nr:fumarylacetoacetate hydrolase family protein [Fodinibius salsisoli]MCW9706072.1 fumarylacetoacetate hydrolase family protein [Fodinibius salsisoli]